MIVKRRPAPNFRQELARFVADFTQGFGFVTGFVLLFFIMATSL